MTRIQLARPVPAALASEFAKRLYFVSNEIESFDLVRVDGAVDAVDVAVATTGSVPAVTEKINRLVADDILGQRPLPPRVAWRSPVERIGFVDYLPALLESGAAFVAGEGQLGFGQPILGLIDYLDRRLRAIALGLPNSSEFQYPTLLPTSVLDRFGYFGSFPQFAMFVTRLHNDLDSYRSFVAAYQEQERLPADLFDRCVNQDYCLPPTMCYHTYHQLTGSQLAGDRVVTARGKSFRYESRYHSGLERLWDFTIRELVFLGTPEFVLSCRDETMRRAYALVEELGLAGRCEVANDHFFATPDTASKILSQRVMELKFELQLPVAANHSIAAGSFNLHGPFFGESFDITDADGEPVTSGCVGFGLERLAHAFLSQHGPNPADWPVTETT